MLSVNTLIIIFYAVGIETCSGTDSSVNGVSQSVVYGKVYYKIVETVRNAIPKMLCVNTLVMIPHSVGIETCSGTYGTVNSISQSINYIDGNGEVVHSAWRAVGYDACINTAEVVACVEGVERGTCTDGSFNAVPDSVEDGEVYNYYTVAPLCSAVSGSVHSGSGVLVAAVVVGRALANYRIQSVS